jgi:hypothetical protein
MLARVNRTAASRARSGPVGGRRAQRWHLFGYGWRQPCGIRTDGKREGAMAEVKIRTPRGGDADLCGHPGCRGAVAGGGGPARLRRDEPGPAPAGRLAGRRGLPGRRPRPVLVGRHAALSAHRHARAGHTARANLRRHRGRPGLPGRPPRLHGQDRRDRLLHGRRLRAGARAWPRVLGRQHQLRRLPSDAERVLAGACPIVASYGGKDRSPMGATGPGPGWSGR